MSIPTKFLSRTLIPAALIFFAAGSAMAQGYVQSYNYSEIQTQTSDPVIFGVAYYKLCEIKNFLFSAVYILGAIAFVIFALKSLFTKFEIKHFVPILGALFIVASADLIIAFMSPNAFYCPTAFSQL